MIRTISVLREVTEANSLLAGALRADFIHQQILVLNLIASPGAGKTSLLEQTIARLRGELSLAVIEGDPASTLDAERIAAAGVPVVQINTGGGCHLEARMIQQALPQVQTDAPGGGQGEGERATGRSPLLDVIVIENVGNLLCPTGWDLGEDAKVVVASLPEGSDKPLKYPMAFLTAQAVVINKIDLAPYLPAKVEELHRNALTINPDLAVFEVSCVTGEGLEEWIGWIRAQLALKRAVLAGQEPHSTDEAPHA
jgi:hydrogenase nickel incorporation protein HypB